ncbi:MAG TPA: hypothetical protein VKU80_17220 [Planctomycetota bacterium]|nr:hypothetical protein [Planctomycetota bacterium]
MVSGTGGNALWVFTREDVEKVLVMGADLEACRKEFGECQTRVAGKPSGGFWQSKTGAVLKTVGIFVLMGSSGYTGCRFAGGCR